MENEQKSDAFIFAMAFRTLSGESEQHVWRIPFMLISIGHAINLQILQISIAYPLRSAHKHETK